MSADLQATLALPAGQPHDRERPSTRNGQPASEDGEAEEAEEDEEDEEAKLKYAKLTSSLTSVYRNGDSTSAFCVAGDKMVMGTHNGNIHVLSLPSLQVLRTYHAHSATITSISVSPTPPPPTTIRTETGSTAVLSPPPLSRTPTSQPNNNTTTSASPRKPQQPRQEQAVLNTPNNQVYIATSSLDGHVCISSLVDPKDVQLRNFARPVQAIALSPDYKNDRTYLSAGLAGQLILTIGGKIGGKEDANTNSSSAAAAAAAGGWLGLGGMGMGFGGTTGKDTVLHSGEGGISTIKWSLSGKWVVWVNEEGIKIMRSHLRLDSEASEDAWRRIAHAEKPNKKGWEEGGGLWRGRCDWVDEGGLEGEGPGLSGAGGETSGVNGANGTVKSTASGRLNKSVEKLVVGWGDTAWILHVHDGGTSAKGTRQVGSADIMHKLQFRDCVVSGIALYTPSTLAILAYRTRDDDDKPLPSATMSPRKGRQIRQSGLAPQLRLVNAVSGEEVDLDELPMSRFETLGPQDYHLGTLWMPPPPSAASETKGQKGSALLGNLFELSGGAYASKMFTSSGASGVSVSSSGNEGEKKGASSFTSPQSSTLTGSGRGGAGVTPTPPPRRRVEVPAHPYATEVGLKLWIQSPYDCVLAIRRDLSDHLDWLLERRRYAEAWTVIEEHPEIVDVDMAAEGRSLGSGPSSPSRRGLQEGSLADFFADSASSDDVSGVRAVDGENSAAAREKRRIGDLWLQQLVTAGQWAEAGRVVGKVLGSSGRWEHWVWTFAQADKFDEITPFIPTMRLRPALPSLVYEVVLGHYISADPVRFAALLQVWDTELFDVGSVLGAVERRLDPDGGDGALEVGGLEWECLVRAQGRLYLACGRAREALHAYIRVQDAEAAMGLVRDEKLIDAVADDVAGLMTLKVSSQALRTAPLEELQAASAEAVAILVEAAHKGAIPPAKVIRQLQRQPHSYQPFLYFYLRALWTDNASPPLPGHEAKTKPPPLQRRDFDRHLEESHSLVEDHADLAISLFAEYDRSLLLDLLRTSSTYTYEAAAALCEQRHYIPELIHVYSKMGNTKKALFLIIGDLRDVSQAIAFAKEHPDLWDDLVGYSMDKPLFIRGLLEEGGATEGSVDLIRKIPEGLEVEGLRMGLQRLVREFGVQCELSMGVARVLRGEVQGGMEILREGRGRGVGFEVAGGKRGVGDVKTKGMAAEARKRRDSKGQGKAGEVRPGHCAGCGERFPEQESSPLIGFPCAHVYHLPCLLRANPATSDEVTIQQLLDQLGLGDTSHTAEQATRKRSVGGKVARARIIKDVLKGGCLVCLGGG